MPEHTISGHNYKADYKYTITNAQKANGEIQTKEVKLRGDELEPLIGLSVQTFEDNYKAYKAKHMNILSPYEKGYEPTV